jgi:uncharacterized protein (UPF0332 family)
MTGDDFLAVAAALLAQPDSHEAVGRTIVSRAYYGAFHTARGLLADLGFSVGRDQALPARWLMVCGDENAREAGKLLSELQGERVKADYDLATPRFRQRNLVKELVARAFELQRLVSACRNEPARSAVKAGIEAYQRKITGKP